MTTAERPARNLPAELVRRVTSPLTGRGLGRNLPFVTATDNFLVSRFVRGTGVRQILGHTMYLDLSDRGVGLPLFLTGSYEPGETALFQRLLEPGMVVVDVGAHAGYYTLIAARGVSPFEILAITFTNKAAGEMRERVAALVGEGRVVLGTFHGFCARVLRTDGHHVGLLPGFTIYDRDDQVTLVKDLARELSIDPQHVPPRALLAAISRWKNDGLPAGEALAGDGTPFERVEGSVYGRYAEALAAANAADFDDLLLLVTRLFRERPDVLDRYRRRFEHVLVDEYQDTNLVHYRLARDVAAGTGNLCATGAAERARRLVLRRVQLDRMLCAAAVDVDDADAERSADGVKRHADLEHISARRLLPCPEDSPVVDVARL